MRVPEWLETSAREHTRLYFGLCVLILGIFSLYFIYSRNLNSPVIRSDGEGYYAYLPATLIYHDITLTRLVDGPLRGTPPQGAALWPGTDSYLLKYPAGEAILMSPFFLIGWVAAYLFHQALDGYSAPFQYAAAFSGLLYAVVGLIVLWSVLERYFKRSTVLIGLSVLLFGTNLFHYVTYDAIFSHTYSFFLFVVFLYFVERLYSLQKLLDFVLLGIVAGLIVITRPTNALWLLFGVLFGLTSLRDLRDRLAFWMGAWRKWLLALLAFLAVVSIQVLYWHAITGAFVVYSYPGEFFDFARPQLLNVLFSVRKGLFFWSPIVLTVFPGLFYARRLAPAYFVPILVFFPLNIYLISSWTTWWYGGSFGQRPFVESMPMFAIAFCSLYQGVGSTIWRRLLLALSIGACALSGWLMLKYWLGIIPFDGVTWRIFVRTFWRLRKH